MLTRDLLDQLAQLGHLDARALAAARQLAGLAPDARAWARFLERSLVIGGGVLLAAALVYFVAYNWQAMGRLAKIALLQVAVVLPAALAWRWAADALRSRAALLAALLAVGPLLAYVGQTYQTGADNFELFLAWALLVLPFVLAARWRPAWCVWVLLVNLALGLYFAEAWRPWLDQRLDVLPLVVHVLLNACLLAIAEACATRLAGGARLLERLLATLLLAAAALLYLHFLFDEHRRSIWVLLAPAVACAIFVWYRRRRLDVPILAIWSFAMIVCAVSTLAKLLISARATADAFLLIGLAAIGLSAWAASWLRDLARCAAPQGGGT
jgi:uncharacterized membrane protein